jgi:hypothetical protein
VPTNAKVWIQKIKDLGNEANHEIAIRTHDEAERMLKFSEMLLRLVYEFPAHAEPGTPAG